MSRKNSLIVAVSIASSIVVSTPGLADPPLRDKCPVNMVPAGPLCIDAYEASVWSKPPRNNGTPRGTQFGVAGDDYPCSFTGDDCVGAIFAVSAPGEMPSAFITWFQALQACANVGKRLPTNAEWHVAAAGTPDTGGADDGATTCNTDNLVPGASRTGSRQDCVSDRGAFDMGGNLLEWVADWIQGDSVPFEPTGDEGTAGPDFGDDFMRGTNPATRQGSGENFPSAIVRGGSFIANTAAGVFVVNAQFSPATGREIGGFRCVLPQEFGHHLQDLGIED